MPANLGVSDNQQTMKSIKKRFKTELADIRQLATELTLLSSEIGVLRQLEQVASTITDVCDALMARASELKKTEFVAGIAEAESLEQLRDAADNDLISSIEDAFFAHSPHSQDEWFQQLLAKLEWRYVSMLEKIQQLLGLLDEADED